MSILVIDIVASLRTRLNDADGGAYTDAEIRSALLQALQDTEMATRSNLTVETADTVAQQAQYTFNQFELLEVTYEGVPLTKRTLPDLIAQGYTSDIPLGTPSAYAVVSGGTITLSPVPVGIGELKVFGYSTTSSLGSSITTVPASVVAQVVTNRAEMILRMWRPTVSGNVEIASALGQILQSFLRVVTR